MVRVGRHDIGPGHPVFVVAEVGINHNGDVALARRLIDAAVAAGCDAVKLQKRTPRLCVPPAEWERPRSTPWGVMPYIEYRERIELDEDDYCQIADHCRRRGILWFSSCWDVDAVDFVERFDPPVMKVASACLTDESLLLRMKEAERPIFLSTGMSTVEEIDDAVSIIGDAELVILHSTSCYPCPPEQVNLRVLQTLSARYGRPVGYSGHEIGSHVTWAAVGLGACVIERHLTVDRTMWGSDQSASVEPPEMVELVRGIRLLETALGDGHKRLYPEELVARQRLRRVRGDREAVR